MKREEITALFPEATKEQLDKIMAINGADITNAKTGMSDLQNQLANANSELEKLKASAEGIDADRESLKATKAELKQLKEANAIRDMKEKVSKETGVPVNLLSGKTEDDCKAQAEAIKEYAQPSGYPSVKDAGEPGTVSKPDTRTQFADWFNKIQ